MKPRVSVVIPYFNREYSLPAALQSVESQTFSDWEIVVVDDGSVRSPEQLVEEVIRSGRWRVVRHEINRGVAAARNSGIRNAKGDFVAFLDSDDAWHSGKLEAQLSLLDRIPDPRNAFCVTRTHVDMGGGWLRELPIRPVGNEEDFSEFLYVGHGFAQTSSFLLHRSRALDISFCEYLRQYEDHLFFLMAGRCGLNYRLVPDSLVIWNNDPRSDRIGAADSLERGRQFLHRASGYMTERARLAFQTRYLGQALVREDPIGALRLFGRARQADAVSARDLATLAMRCVLPSAGYNQLRRAFSA